MESVVEAIKTQTDAIAALAAAVEKMSRTVSNFVFAQRGSRKQSGSQGQSEVREKKKKAEEKKNAGATSVAAAESTGADAEDAEAVTAKDMAEVAEEKKNAGKKEEREKIGRKEAEKNKETERNMSAEVGATMMTATSDAETSGADAGGAAEPTLWKCSGDFSGNSSRWQEDASETTAVNAEAVVSYRLREEGDDMLCGVMKNTEEEEVPVAEVVSYAATVAAVTVLAMAMMAVTTKVVEAEEAAAAAMKAAEPVEAEATAVRAAEAVGAEAIGAEEKTETATKEEAATEAEAEAPTKQQNWNRNVPKLCGTTRSNRNGNNSMPNWNSVGNGMDGGQR